MNRRFVWIVWSFLIILYYIKKKTGTPTVTLPPNYVNNLSIHPAYAVYYNTYTQRIAIEIRVIYLFFFLYKRIHKHVIGSCPEVRRLLHMSVYIYIILYTLSREIKKWKKKKNDKTEIVSSLFFLKDYTGIYYKGTRVKWTCLRDKNLKW